MKKNLLTTIAMLSALMCTPQQKVHGECLGKMDLGAAYIHLDVIESRNTVKELDMPGIRADLSYVFNSGWIIKPNALYGKEDDGEITNLSIGFGRCIPIYQKWIITPTVGVTYTNMCASIHLDYGDLGQVDFNQRFKAIAPYAGLEIIYNFAPNWRLCGTAQYAWSHSKTKIKRLLTDKCDAQGPSYALLLEYDVSKRWSINLAGAYNESYSREKNGLRARGAKIGLVRWF